MVDSPDDPGTRGAPPTPRWVKALGIAGIVAVLLVVAVMLVGGGDHGPGRHAPAGDSGAASPTASGAITPVAVRGPIAVRWPAFTSQVPLP